MKSWSREWKFFPAGCCIMPLLTLHWNLCGFCSSFLQAFNCWETQTLAVRCRLLRVFKRNGNSLFNAAYWRDTLGYQSQFTSRRWVLSPWKVSCNICVWGLRNLSSVLGNLFAFLSLLFWFRFQQWFGSSGLTSSWSMVAPYASWSTAEGGGACLKAAVPGITWLLQRERSIGHFFSQQSPLLTPLPCSFSPVTMQP